MLKIAVFSLKGGTTKSATALNLGAAFAQKQWKTLLIDLDGQRTLSHSLGWDGKTPTAIDWFKGEEAIALARPNFYIVPGDLLLFTITDDKRDWIGPSLKRLQRQSKFDLVLLDCPPALGILSRQTLLKSDRVLMPTLCEPASLKGLAEAVSLIRGDRPNMPIEVLRSRYRPRLVLTREIDRLLEDGATEMGFNLLKTTVPENVSVAESIAHSKPVADYSPNSAGAKAYNQLADECKQLWSKS